MVQVLALEGVGHDGLVLHAGQIGVPAPRSARIIPSSCQGVVFAAGNGKCQEMLSLRIVVARGSRACLMPPARTALDGIEDRRRLDPENGDPAFAHALTVSLSRNIMMERPPVLDRSG